MNTAEYQGASVTQMRASRVIRMRWRRNHSTPARWLGRCVAPPPQSRDRRHGHSAASCSAACGQAGERQLAAGCPAARRGWRTYDEGHGCVCLRSPPLCVPSTRVTGCDRAAARNPWVTGRRTRSLIEAAAPGWRGPVHSGRTRLSPVFASARSSVSPSTSRQRKVLISLFRQPDSSTRRMTSIWGERDGCVAAQWSSAW